MGNRVIAVVIATVLATLSGCSVVTPTKSSASTTDTTTPTSTTEAQPSLRTMAVGQTAYVEAFALSLDRRRHWWLDTDWEIADYPHEDNSNNFDMRVQRTGNGYELWTPSDAHWWPSEAAGSQPSEVTSVHVHR